MNTALGGELTYILLVFGLFVVPKMLQRVRLPGAITSILLGVAAGAWAPAFVDDSAVRLLATLGIVALFLFAGMDVDVGELRSSWRTLTQHLGVQALSLALVTWIAVQTGAVGVRAGVIVALALVTPSTGFILDSLPAFGLSDTERFWVKAKAISTELLALALLFVVLQSETASRLGLSFLALAAILALVPLAFRAFAVVIRPFAPKSDFAFVVIVALVCAFATRRLGVYYLVGAFIVGIAARRFNRVLPSMSSDNTLHAVEVFASFFVPFYFFRAGMHLRPDDLTWESIGTGVGLFLVVSPLRVLRVTLQRRLTLHEDWRTALRISTPLLPTLVFTMVLAEILREQFHVADWIFGGLMVYAILNTLVPGLVLRAPLAEPDLLALQDKDPSALPAPP